MGHIVHRHGAITLGVEHKGVHHALDVTQRVGILIVEHLLTVHHIKVHIQVGLEVAQGDGPRLVAGVLHQRVNTRVDNQPHRVGTRDLGFKSHGTVLGDFG